MDTTTTIFCTYKTYVEQYNNFMLQKQLSIT
jgi:hypothetical protein